MSSERQSLQNLQGEVAFRRKLAKQHTTGEILLPDYFGKDEHDRILAERLRTTETAFTRLQGEGCDFSSFVELGAERAHRSLVLANRFDACGFALDLSLDQLRTAEHFARQFGLPKIPGRICCDANNLPFRSESVPFLFCYQFLHHFPDLGPIISEIHRVLGEGTFFFDEEPLGRVLQWHFYQQDKGNPNGLRKLKLVRWLEGFISDAACDEVEHGVVENHSMPLNHWREHLSRFDSLDVKARTLRHLRSRVTKSPRLANIPNQLLGGVIYGSCRKKSSRPPDREPEHWLGCPACRLPQAWDRPPLERVGDVLICQEKGCRYPVVDDIPVLIESGLRRQLYPELD